MSDYEKLNDRRDPFCEHLRQRLIDKPSPLDANCWDEIEQRLQKKKTKLPPVWLGLTVAASVIIAVFILFNIEKDIPEQQNLFVLEENTVDKVDLVDESDVYKDIKTEEKQEVEKDIKNSVRADLSDKNKTSQKADGKSSEENKLVDTSIENRVIISNDNAVAENKTPVTEENLSSKEAHNTKTDNSIDSSIKTVDFADIGLSQKGSGNRWLILSGIVPAGGLGYLLSSSSSLFVAENHNSFDSSPEGISPPLDDDVDYHGEDPREEISDINYFIPITYGMTARKRINKTLGIETGIVYTFLKTDYKINNAPVTQKLHYLGVPVKLIVNVWEKKSWGVYVSGGGMVEKGLQSVYQKKGESGKVKQSVSGLQWSLSSGVGLSYRIYKDINLYLEPCFSYYFDTSQPISIRTEDPFNFNLRMGLRYDF
jgi:hypothetical protein